MWSLDHLSSSNVSKKEVEKESLYTSLHKQVLSLHEEIADPEADAERLDSLLDKEPIPELFYTELQRLVSSNNDAYTNKLLSALLTNTNFKNLASSWSVPTRTQFCYKTFVITGIHEEFYTALVWKLSPEQKLNGLDAYLPEYTKHRNINGRAFLIKHVLDIQWNRTEPVLKEKINDVIEALWKDYFLWFPPDQLDFAECINKHFWFFSELKDKEWGGLYFTAYDVLFSHLYGFWRKDSRISRSEDTWFIELYRTGKLVLNIEEIASHPIHHSLASARTLIFIMDNIIPPTTAVETKNIIINKQFAMMPSVSDKALLVVHGRVAIDNADPERTDDIIEHIMDNASTPLLIDRINKSKDAILNNSAIKESVINNIQKRRAPKDMPEISKQTWLELEIPEKKWLLSVEQYSKLERASRVEYITSLPNRHAIDVTDFNWNIVRIIEYIEAENDPDFREILFRNFQDKYLLYSNEEGWFDIARLKFFEDYIINKIDFYMSEHTDFILYIFANHESADSHYQSKIKIIEYLSIKEKISDQEYETLSYCIKSVISKWCKENDIVNLVALSDRENKSKTTVSPDSGYSEFLVFFNKLAHTLDFKIPTIDKDLKDYCKESTGSIWNLLDLVWSQANYERNKIHIKEYYKKHVPSRKDIQALLYFDKSDEEYNDILIQRLKDHFSQWFDWIWDKADRKILDTSQRDAIEKSLLWDADSQQEIRSTFEVDKKILFLLYCNTFDILVDPRIFMKFDATQQNTIERDSNVIIEFLKWVDVDSLERYKKFGIESLQSIIDMLIFYMQDNNDAIRRMATQKATQTPGQYRSPALFERSLEKEDYGWENTMINVWGANNAHTLDKVENIDNQNLPEWASPAQERYYYLVQEAIQHMSTKTVKVSKTGQSRHSKLQETKQWIEFNQAIENKIELYLLFVEKLQKYATATLYQFLEDNSPEPGMSEIRKKSIKEYLAWDRFTWSTLYTQKSDRLLAWFEADTLGVAKTIDWETSIHLNISGIVESIENNAWNETKSDFDALADVFLHEFIHVVDHSFKWDYEWMFDNTNFRWVELEEVLTEVFATYLEILGNEKEMTSIMQKALKKWMNNISFIQFLNEGYEDWSDDAALIEFFEFARESWKLWNAMELYVEWDLSWFRLLIDTVYAWRIPPKTWKDIIPEDK